MSTRKHLEGLKVIDFSAVYAGPICARFLSDCGADVIKVEPPNGGDMTRNQGGGDGRIFAHFNAGKRSIAIDLKKPAGRAIARQLIADADVVIENFRPGIMAKFGLDYDSLKEENPALVYCSISGFGQSGPFVHRAAFAPIVHAASGFDDVFTQLQTDPDARPPVWGIMVADMLTGSHAFGAIQTALLGRARSGVGEYIDVSMMESMMLLIPAQFQAAQIENPPVPGRFHPIKVNDGFVMICVVSDKNMRCLCEAMNRSDMLEDARFITGERMKNLEAFTAEIETWSCDLTAQECETLLNESGVPCSVYNRPEELFSHSQVLNRGSFKEVKDEVGTFLIQNTPFQFRSVDVTTSTLLPKLGEQTDEVLNKVLNFSAEDIKRFREEGVVS